MYFPKNGGTVSGKISGDCSGSIGGNYNGSSTGSLAGSAKASCQQGFLLYRLIFPTMVKWHQLILKLL